MRLRLKCGAVEVKCGAVRLRLKCGEVEVKVR